MPSHAKRRADVLHNRNQPSKFTGWGNMTKIVTYICVALLAIVLLVYLRRHMPAAECARRPPCMSTLGVLGKCCEMFRLDHAGQNPDRLQDLTRYCRGPSDFVCPDRAGTTPGSLTNVDTWSDYRLISVPSNAPPETMQILCMPHNHKGMGGNVLFRDGSVGWLQYADFKKEMRRINNPEDPNKTSEPSVAPAPQIQR